MILERQKLEKLVEELSKGDKIDFEFPFFMLYLRSITSGTISRVLMLQVASEKLIFSSIVPYLNRIIVLMTQWRYPQAKAAEIISAEAPTKGFSDTSMRPASRRFGARRIARPADAPWSIQRVVGSRPRVMPTLSPEEFAR